MNTNRVFPRTANCFGLVAVIESKRIVLPLKGVECDFSIQAGTVEVCLTQIFRQENPKPLDCDYLFPLPADASVYCCEADINGRIIRATVRERAEAVKLAAEKKAEGNRVVLVESERENLFTLTLNNLQPDDLILIKLKYIQPLRLLADMPSVEIPFCPGIHYIPGNPLIRSNRGRGVMDDTDQVPDASRISPVRVDKEHPDAAFIEIRGTLDAKFVEAASLISPSHNIISRLDGENLTVRLSDKDEVPDRDLVLRWKENEPETVTSRAWIQKREHESYALVEIRAPKASAGTESPMDFYFLVDRSGSMQGIKWEKAALAVQSCVRTLGKSDRAMITLFGTHTNDFAEQPLSPNQLLADPNLQNLTQMPPDGGTELGNALRHVLDISVLHSANRQKTLILITDAQVGNEPEILKIMTSAPDFPVHCFGIDIALNDSLLLALARQQRGTFHSLNPADDVARVVTDLAQTIRHPVLHDLQLCKGWETASAGIPPLYSGQVYYLSARTTNRTDLQLSARNGAREPLPISISNQPASGDAPYLHWSKQRIQRCIAERKESEAIALSVLSNLICPLTAYIAWDETEKVAVAQHALVQPIMENLQMEDLILASYCSSGNSKQFSPRIQAMRTSGGVCYLMEPRPELDASEVVQKIADAQGFHGTPLDETITIEERREAFNEIFSRIWGLCFRPEWKPLCDCIFNWTFDNQKEALSRSNLVAGLLSEQLRLVSELRLLRTELFARIHEVRKATNGKIPMLDVLETKLKGAAFDPSEFIEISNHIRQVDHVFRADKIEKLLQRIAVIQGDINQQLAAFSMGQRLPKPTCTPGSSG
jgi:Ca-activated chloride channel homolog